MLIEAGEQPEVLDEIVHARRFLAQATDHVHGRLLERQSAAPEAERLRGRNER